jgi:hypothetical protein
MIRCAKFISVLVIICTVLCGNAFARGEANNLTVALVRVDESGKGYVKLNGTITPVPGEQRPACVHASQLDYRNSFSFDATTELGKAVMTLALTALVSGKTIFARGTSSDKNQCPHFSEGVEAWGWGQIQK